MCGSGCLPPASAPPIIECPRSTWPVAAVAAASSTGGESATLASVARTETMGAEGRATGRAAEVAGRVAAPMLPLWPSTAPRASPRARAARTSAARPLWTARVLTDEVEEAAAAAAAAARCAAAWRAVAAAGAAVEPRAEAPCAAAEPTAEAPCAAAVRAADAAAPTAPPTVAEAPRPCSSAVLRRNAGEGVWAGKRRRVATLPASASSASGRGMRTPAAAASGDGTEDVSPKSCA